MFYTQNKEVVTAFGGGAIAQTSSIEKSGVGFITAVITFGCGTFRGTINVSSSDVAGHACEIIVMEPIFYFLWNLVFGTVVMMRLYQEVGFFTSLGGTIIGASAVLEECHGIEHGGGGRAIDAESVLLSRTGTRLTGRIGCTAVSVIVAVAMVMSVSFGPFFEDSFNIIAFDDTILLLCIYSIIERI